MAFGTLTLDSPVIKGAGKVALGVSVWGMVMALDALDALPNDALGKATKYAGLMAGAIYAIRGATTFMLGD